MTNAEYSKAETWKKIDQIFEEALELASESRSRFIIEACGDDLPLRRAVDRLIEADRKAEGFLHEPVVAALEKKRRVGPYRLLRLLGHGGMGEVHLAARDDGQYEGLVAIKLIRRGQHGDEATGRFRRTIPCWRLHFTTTATS